ncbi:MAG: putative endonuclease [Flavobacterium sp.]|jgi:putative endonuclease
MLYLIIFNRLHTAIMKFYYVYILLCNDKSLYVGVTSNLERRLEEHNSGKYSNAYTFKRRPVELVYFQNFTEPTVAIFFEKQLKKWIKVKKQALIENNFEKIQEYAECRNASHFKYNKDNSH